VPQSRTLQAFYAFVAFRWLRLTGALWVLYLLHVGWSLWQVGIAEAAFHAVSFAAGVPTGIFADRAGRRRSLLLGLLALGTLAIGFGALGSSFIGGADQALLHDLSRGLPEGSQAFARLYGRMDAISLTPGVPPHRWPMPRRTPSRAASTCSTQPNSTGWFRTTCARRWPPSRTRCSASG